LKIRSLFFFLAFGIQLSAFSQYWQQQVDYRIDVALNDKEKTLDGFEELTYINHSPDTLTYIWFHLWPNAYKNDRTALSDQLLENGNTKFYFEDKEQRGYINRLNFKVNGSTATIEEHPKYIDMVKLVLPAPLLPSQQILISTPFHVKLPFNFSRGGYDNQTFQLTQWYPKPAVYDAAGWHPMPYLDQGEFYSEFGSFDVRITVPKAYIVAATGELQNRDEIRLLRSRSRKYIADSLYNDTATSSATPPISNNTGTKTLEYKQSNIHDFAWFANKGFIVNYDTCKLSSGKIIDVYTYFTWIQKNIWKKSVQYCKDAIRFYSTEVGEYPYPIVSAVQGPESFGGGMEYPTITVISPAALAKDLDVTLTHEIGHNWFYGLLGSNEREHPWMDEGMNSFYEYKYAYKKYGDKNGELELLFDTKAKRRTDQPIETPAQQFSPINYEVVAYHKTVKWMQLLQQTVGKPSFQQTMHQYFEQWKFKHPQPRDFETVFSQSAPIKLDTVFNYLHTTGFLPNQQRHGWKILTPFTPKVLKSYIDNPSKNLLIATPLLGANGYDKLMPGVIVTNYKLPPSDFQFLLTPMNATGSKRLTGLGKLNYTFYPASFIRMTTLFVNAATFSMDQYTDTTGASTFLQFKKIVPGVRFTFKEKDPRSTVKQFIQWKTYFIKEQSLHFATDTSIRGLDTTLTPYHSLQNNNRWLNQLQWVYDNDRALYPFNITLQIEEAKDFVRPAFTANYFFNYAEEGGLSVRFFAGKFIYTNGKTIKKQLDTDRYQLSLSGPKGYEDYTYSDYFIGRNEYNGWLSQQMMVRDGAFKVRTDLLSSQVGKTDNWLMAANFNTTLPDKINPLSLLPLKIPVHLFADIGTYAEAWQANAETDHFLFDAGLHIPLLSETINLYIPVFYSKVYSNYYKSTIPKNRLLRAISFSINLNNKFFKKANNELEF